MDVIVKSDNSAKIITKKCRIAEVFEELGSMDIGYRFTCLSGCRKAVTLTIFL